MAPEDNPADDVQITQEESNRSDAVRDLRGYVQDMRRHAVGACDAAESALSELRDILSTLPKTDSEVKDASEETLIDCLAETLPLSYRRYSDALEDLASDLKRAVDKHLKAAAEADGLRSYIAAGDFSD